MERLNIRQEAQRAQEESSEARSTTVGAEERHEFRRNVPIGEIVLRPQVRQHFDQQAIEELAQSIRQHGLLQPVLLRRHPSSNKLELIAGERRVRASLAAGLSTIPAFIRRIEEHDIEDVQIIENLHRRDLNEIEKTEALLRQYARTITLTDEAEAAKIIRRLRKRRDTEEAKRLLEPTQEFFKVHGIFWESFASSHLVNLGYPEDIKALVRNRGLEISKAKLLMRIKDPQLRKVISEKTLSEDWSVRRLATEVSQQEARPEAKRASIRRVDLSSIEAEIERIPRARRRAAMEHLAAIKAILQEG